MKKKSIAIAALIVSALLAFDVLAFRGSCFAETVFDPPTTHFHSRQYFMGTLIWERDWYDPPLTNSTPPKECLAGYIQEWRGLGLLFRGKKQWLD